MDRKTTVSVAISMGQLERLTKVIEQTRISRSVIVRDALERELQRYEKRIGLTSDAAGSVGDSGAVVRNRTRRRP